jgi:hypothetical protein
MIRSQVQTLLGVPWFDVAAVGGLAHHGSEQVNEANASKGHGPQICLDGRMAKLADALALGASGETLGGSNPLPPTNFCRKLKSSRVTIVFTYV